MELTDQLPMRRQFMLTKTQNSALTNLKSYSVGNLFLYAHQELNVQVVDTKAWHVVLVGDLYDYQNPERQNQEILETAVSSVISLEDLLVAFDTYCGSFFVLAFQLNQKHHIAFTDMAASREFFYMTSGKQLLAASQPKTFEDIEDISHLQDPEFDVFLNSKYFESRKTLIADKTEFEEILRLKPNHYLDLDTGQSQRYFPSQALPTLTLTEAAQQTAAMLKGFVTAIHLRSKLAIPVSAGWESRVLLAASKHISGEVAYFVYQHPYYGPNHQDVSIPKRLLKKLGQKLKVITYSPVLDEEVSDALNKQLSFPRLNNFAYLVNGFQKAFPGYGMLNGNISEIARMEYDEIDITSGREAALLLKYPGLSYAVEVYQQWMKMSKSAFDTHNYRLADMLYWEMACATWVAKTNTETRMVAEITQPFNCRSLIVSMAASPKRYRSKQTARLYREIVKILWPECLVEPVNPGFKKKVIRTMQSLRVYGFYRKLLMKYQLMKIANS